MLGATNGAGLTVNISTLTGSAGTVAVVVVVGMVGFIFGNTGARIKDIFQ